MKVVEKFVSINGEGTRAGELAVFVRFQGCNLRCSYCDTMWANEADCPYTEESPEEILEYIRKTGIKNVTLTGGEPLLQKDIDRLIGLILSEDELRVEIETNGAVDLAPFTNLPAQAGAGRQEDDATARRVRPVFTMDYKLPSSGWEAAMKPENFRLLTKEDTVKFVAGSREDLARAKELIDQWRLTGICHVYFSPVFGKIEPVEIVDFMIENKLNEARMQIQMHKVIWDPNARGV